MTGPRKRLTETVKGGGCAAKIGPGDLTRILGGLKPRDDPRVLLGLDVGDDAGIFALTDDIALVQTTDFFTPIVDDPFAFGQIAAANALSDVYAMGGTPLCALNIVCFPLEELGGDVLRATLAGGLEKCDEAGVPIVGGHSVRDPEFKYGLAVTGKVHPKRFWTKAGAQVGDRLILTKPIGTGAISQAIKRGLLDEAAAKPAIDSMRLLNGIAQAVVEEMDVHACTDVTGFGLGGHAAQMVLGQPVGFNLFAERIPLLDGALTFVREGLVPGGCHRNREHYGQVFDIDSSIDEALATLLFDPQTSGGLLLAMPEADAEGVVERLGDEGLIAASIGEVTKAHPGRIAVR